MSSITDGKIVLNGATGGVLQGTYEGRLVQASGAFSVEVKINDGSIRATRADSEEGKATLRGAMSSDEDFTTALDGWLLHHVRAEQ